jgi:hypothetical protein
MMPLSTRELSLAQICAGLPAWALAISFSISSTSRSRRLIGAIASFCIGAGSA